jgi:hypothetical protein
MTLAIPTTEPSRITQGERVNWTRSFSEWSAALYTLQYRFRGPSTGFNINATADGIDFAAEIPAATTATMSTANGGKWKWDAYVTEIANALNVEHVCSGYVYVYPGVAAGNTAAVDNRSAAEIQLAAIDAALAGDAGMIVEYEQSTPAGSVRVKKARTTLLDERKYWAGIVAREKGGNGITLMRTRMRG